MSGFRTPEVPREQLVLWKHRLEDAIPSDHPVRHLDYLLRSGAFAETFAEMEREYVLNKGKPPYHPRVLAGLYFYGMLERIRSSRKLEKACYSRLDVIWLMEGQTPDHSTIADFICRHGKQLRKLFHDVLEVMQRAELVTLDHVALDGTKIEGDAGKSSVRSGEKIKSWASHLDAKIAAMEKEFAENEKREASLFGGSNPWVPPKTGNAKKELAELRRKQELLKKALEEIERRQQEHVGRKPPKRIASTTDPDARSMPGKDGASRPNYNAQAGVDGGYGGIVSADVNDQPDDSGQLTPMVDQAIENCGRPPQAVTADSQYNTGPDLAAMEERQIDCYLPNTGENSEAAPLAEAQQEALDAVHQERELTEPHWDALPKNTQGKFDKSAFAYDKEKDVYRCPAGQTLVPLGINRDKKKWGTAERQRYGGCAACATCQHAALCCKDPEKGRTINRDQYEDHRERLRERMATEAGQEIYKRRKFTVEPRFGHIKRNMGIKRFMRRGLEKVKTEWTMICTAVNLGILLRNWEEVVKVL